MRVLIFGVDGLSFRVIHPMMQAGYLPNFQALANEGVESVLESKFPPFTPPAWTSIVTGMKPAKHGVYDFWEYDEHGRDQLVTGRKAGKAIWNLLSDYGRRVLVLNVPLTYPPEPVNGIFVSGFPGAHETGDFTYPHTFRDELIGHVPNYSVDLDKDALRRSEHSHAEQAVLVTENRLALMRHLLREKDWDFAFVVYRLADHLQHKRWPEVTAMRPEELRYYQLVDKALGEAREAVGRDGYLFVVSDHGFQGTRAIFSLNEYLYRRHWLHSERNQQRGRQLAEALAKVTFKRMGVIYPVRVAKRRVLGLLPGKHHDNDRAKMRMAPYLTREEQLAAGVSMPSWSGTAGGYAVLRMSEPYSPQQIADLRGELLEIRDPETGKPLVDASYSTEAFGEGPYAPEEECLLLLASDGITFTPVLGKPFLWEYEMRIFGTHQKDGVFYACGPTITAGARGPWETPFAIYDVLPTVLHTFGLPLPGGLDGRVLHEIFAEPALEQSAEEAVESAVVRKLRLLQRR
jgi:predicted AlkP superfamily phosphohydrolase/phosphomutase